MGKLTDVQMPPDGLLLLFTPNGGQYKAQLAFNAPEGMSEEEQAFYLSLGHGLIYVAVCQTKDIVDVGQKAIEELRSKDGLEDDPNSSQQANIEDVINNAFDETAPSSVN